MKPQFKIDVIYLFTFLLLCKIFGPLQSESWTVITLPIWFFIVDSIISVPYNYIKRKWKNRNAKPQEKEDWNKRLDEIRKVQPPKPMKFNR